MLKTRRRMSKVTFISYQGSVGESDKSWVQRQQLLHRTAIEFGKVDSDKMWTRNDLVISEFYRHHRDVLDDPRGGGLWAWKPWVILQTLEQVQTGDYVLYHDVGKPFREGDSRRGGSFNHGNVVELPIQSIIEWAEDHDGMFPGVNTPHYGPASQWTKRDCFVGMDCDREEIWRLPLVQAGYNAWKKTSLVTEFLHKWLKYCCDRRLVSDDENCLGLPNLHDFSEHRHDQSILTNLVRSESVVAYGSETIPTPYVRNFNYLVRRTGLDRVESIQAQTLTKLVTEAGGSKNLPVSVTSWVDLDLANRDFRSLDVLCIRTGQNKEEKLLESHLRAANWHVLDISELDPDRYGKIEGMISRLPVQYDWIFNYGVKDQALLVYLSRLLAQKLKPMAYMIAGLDHSLHFVGDETFNQFIQQLTHTRCLVPSVNARFQENLSLVVGTATNPVLSKKRRGKVIVASIQSGVPDELIDHSPISCSDSSSSKSS